MDENLLRELKLDRESIERDMRASYGLAQIYEERGDAAERAFTGSGRDDFLVAASCYRRAGAHALLLGLPEQIDLFFLGATRNYDRLDMAYGALVVALSTYLSDHRGHVRHSILAEEGEAARRPGPLRRQRVYSLLAYAAQPEGFEGLSEPARRVRRELEPYRAFPMGVLGIPLSDLLDLADALAPEMAPESLRREIQPQQVVMRFVDRYTSALSVAMRNRHHWEWMAMPFHPAEPDIFGIFGLTAGFRRGDIVLIDLQRIFEEYSLPWEARTLLTEVYRSLPGTSAPDEGLLRW